MSSKVDLVVQIVMILLLNNAYPMDTQNLGNIFRDPFNNLIKVFDGSYGSSSDFNQNHQNYENNQNRKTGHSLSYQPRFATDSNRFVQSGSNCAGTWSYLNNGGRTIGLVTIQNPDRLKNVLKLTMSLSAALPSKYPGSIDLAKDKDTAAHEMENGLPVMYHVNFPLENPLPKILTITLNDRTLCSESGETAPFVTLTLQHTFFTSLSNVPQQMPSWDTNTPPPVQSTQRPSTVIPYTAPPLSTRTSTVPTSTYPTPSPTNAITTISYSNTDSRCGVPDFKPPKTTALVFGGFFAMRKQFPWLAAFYYNGGDETGFICGGSLVSSKVVVTAAHCVQNKDSAAKNADQSIFYFGKFNRTDLYEKYFSFSGVDRFFIHPDWKVNENSYDADIALAILIRKISFNSFVKPICLWTSTASFDDVIGQKGTLAGWGKTENSALPSEKPKYAAITIVDTVDCLRSNAAFNNLTSDRTFCAGDRNTMTGPCNGDSGGGLIVLNGNKWYLRGIVSSSLLADGICDTNNYAVFTDVQKFVSWIQSYIQTYG